MLTLSYQTTDFTCLSKEMYCPPLNEELKEELEKLSLESIGFNHDHGVITSLSKDKSWVHQTLKKLQSKKEIIGFNQEDDDDNESVHGVITINKPIQALNLLKHLNLKKRKGSLSSLYDHLDVPLQFRFPISKEIMNDPVVLASAQTYDRLFIHQICPQTRQVLGHVMLIPNNLVRELIQEWCKDHNMQTQTPAQEVEDKVLVEPNFDLNHLMGLLIKLSTSTLSDQKKAANELRLLTKSTPSVRPFLVESEVTIPLLLCPLTQSGNMDKHTDLQEDLVTALQSISILDENKKIIEEHPLVTPAQELEDNVLVVPSFDPDHLKGLLIMICTTLSDRKQAAKELRLLTKSTPSVRPCLVESEVTIPLLLCPLTQSGNMDKHTDLQEYLVTALQNISILDENKKIIGEHPLVIVVVETFPMDMDSNFPSRPYPGRPSLGRKKQARVNTSSSQPLLLPTSYDKLMLEAKEKQKKREEHLARKVPVIDFLWQPDSPDVQIERGKIEMAEANSWMSLAHRIRAIHTGLGNVLPGLVGLMEPNPYLSWPGRPVSFWGPNRQPLVWAEDSWEEVKECLSKIHLRGARFV